MLRKLLFSGLLLALPVLGFAADLDEKPAEKTAPSTTTPKPSTSKIDLEKEEIERKRWRREFQTRSDAVTEASIALEEALRAQRRQRRDNYPRGAPKHAIDQAVTDRIVDFAKANEAYQALFDEAREKNVLPGWYRDFEQGVDEVESEGAEDTPDSTVGDDSLRHRDESTSPIQESPSGR